jgi:hypothetical protein
MISVLFIGIAIMFLCLAIASRRLKSALDRQHCEMIKVIKGEMALEKNGAKGWGSMTTYLYKTVNHHYYLELVGFVIALIAAILESLLASGWH